MNLVASTHYSTNWIDVDISQHRIYERSLIWPTLHEHAELLYQLSISTVRLND